jgi:hypothetical protein
MDPEIDRRDEGDDRNGADFDGTPEGASDPDGFKP